MSNVEELLKIKDEELSKLVKLKDAMRDNIVKLKEENNALKEEIEKVKSEQTSQVGTSYPDLEATIKKLEEQNASLLKAKEDAEFELKKIKVRGKLGGMPADSGDKSGDLPEEDLPVEKVITQLKNGMFKLGQQNFSIENKIDQLLEKLESGAVGVGSPGFANVGLSQGSIPQGKPSLSVGLGGGESASVRAGLTPTPAADSASKDESFRPRRPSDLMGGSKPKDEDKPKPAEEEVAHVRKPSSLAAPLIKIERNEPGDPKSKPEMGERIRKPSDMAAGSPPPKPTLDAEPKAEPLAPVAPAVPGAGVISHALRTVDYPADGVLKCPSCGGQKFTEMQNKAKIISFSPVKKYGKKYYCKDCRIEWDYNVPN
jgi:hypothetical protein